jgi:hypothetical protein
MTNANNWYFFYDSRGFKKEDIKDLSFRLEKLDYKYHQCTGLGAGPSVEQIIAWINNNQFLSTVSIGLLTNFFYDILKYLHTWFVSRKPKKKIVPIVEFFLEFQDIKGRRATANLKFRIDELYDKERLKTLVKMQTEYLYSSSNKECKCVVCNKPIWNHLVFFINRQTKEGPICNFCLEKIVSKSN